MGKPSKVEWPSPRERDVALVAGFRVRGKTLEHLDMRETDKEGYVVTHVSPAHSQCLRLWEMLMKVEADWHASGT